WSGSRRRDEEIDRFEHVLDRAPRLGELAARLDVLARRHVAAGADLDQRFGQIQLRRRLDPPGVVLKGFRTAHDRAHRFLPGRGRRQRDVTDVGSDAAKRDERLADRALNVGIEIVEEEVAHGAYTEGGGWAAERGSIIGNVGADAVRVGSVVSG